MRDNVQMGSRGIVLDVVRVAPSEADAALSDASICLLAFGNAGRGSFDSVVMQPFSCTPCAGVPRCSLVVLVLPTHLAVSVCREDPFLPRPLVECRSCYPIGGGNICTSCIVVNGFYLVDPASSHMLVSKIKPCMYKRSTQALPVALMIHDNSSDRTAFVPATHHSNFCPINFRCWTLGWVDRSAYGVHRLARPFCRRCAPGLNWPGRASGAVTLKKLERTTAKAFAKDVFINQERKLGARRRSDTVLVSTINDADQGSADVAFRTPLAPYEKSKSLGSGGSMVARLKLKGIDGRAPPGVEPAA
ncbi:hypothetical protein RIF29_47893 [Crotalaria pallida]|uniref:Uncharacterized protein n=1 Tax=Crotalaria pallida TaxID=3830 RepID=A0AAN9HJ95_CROPI